MSGTFTGTEAARFKGGNPAPPPDCPWVVRIWPTVEKGSLQTWATIDDDSIFGPFPDEAAAIAFLSHSGREGTTYLLLPESAYVQPAPEDRLDPPVNEVS